MSVRKQRMSVYLERSHRGKRLSIVKPKPSLPYRLYRTATRFWGTPLSSVNLAHARERSGTSRRVSSSVRVSLISWTRLRVMVDRRRWYSRRPINCRDSLATFASLVVLGQPVASCCFPPWASLTRSVVRWCGARRVTIAVERQTRARRKRDNNNKKKKKKEKKKRVNNGGHNAGDN